MNSLPFFSLYVVALVQSQCTRTVGRFGVSSDLRNLSSYLSDPLAQEVTFFLSFHFMFSLYFILCNNCHEEIRVGVLIGFVPRRREGKE